MIQRYHALPHACIYTYFYIYISSKKSAQKHTPTACRSLYICICSRVNTPTHTHHGNVPAPLPPGVCPSIRLCKTTSNPLLPLFPHFFQRNQRISCKYHRIQHLPRHKSQAHLVPVSPPTSPQGLPGKVPPPPFGSLKGWPDAPPGQRGLT